MLYGYARVSTDGQDVAMQVEALCRAGVVYVVRETRSGALHLPELAGLVSRLQRGDELVVYKVDRLARSLRALLALQEKLAAAGVTLRSLTEPIDTGTPIGRAFFQLLGVFAELERDLIRERCSAGRVLARQRGVVFGRPPAVSASSVASCIARGLTVTAAAAELGVARASVARAASRYGLRFPSQSKL